MIIITLLVVGQTHWSCWRWDFIKGSPKSFQYLSINMSCPFKEHKTEPGKTFSLVCTQMEFTNGWLHFQTIGQEQARRFFYSGQKILVPLASHIICDKGSLYAIRIAGYRLTDGVVNIFLPSNQITNQQILSMIIEDELTVLPCKNLPQNGEQNNCGEHKQWHPHQWHASEFYWYWYHWWLYDSGMLISRWCK